MNEPLKLAFDIRVRGIVQGVGFRPFVYNLAQANSLTGWVINDEAGVKIHVEGTEEQISSFLKALPLQHPPAANIESTVTKKSARKNCSKFEILASSSGSAISTRISPDLPTCSDCLADLVDSAGRHFNYPYVNCTNCGPRFSIIHALPYDRPGTTMSDWAMCDQCKADYDTPTNRRFHAQPVACNECGPQYVLRTGDKTLTGFKAIECAAQVLKKGNILAVKSIGGFHLCCDALNQNTVQALRERKFRKDKPFALMVKDIQAASTIVKLDNDLRTLMTSTARPITLAPSKIELNDSLAPENSNLGLLLPYTPLQHMLFALGAPEILVLTSANRSSEPIAYRDDDAFNQLAGIADAFLVGERQIARRMDDSVATSSAFGPVTFRRARGYAPGAVSMLPEGRTILAIGADLKNAITLVVNGQAFVSQHIGDLSHVQCFVAMKETVYDLVKMYDVDLAKAVVVHDAHPAYLSTQFAGELTAFKTVAVQHHRAHIASVLAEKSEFERRVLGIALDGTGYGDDQAIWGGEFFTGSVCEGFERTGQLLNALLPGGDAATLYPPQAAAGFLNQIETPDLTLPPFSFPARFLKAQQMVKRNFQCWKTSSMGRLFDAVAALCGFQRMISFEAQAAIWLENQAKNSHTQVPYSFVFNNNLLDWRPALSQIINDRQKNRPVAEIARAFHEGLATALAQAALKQCEQFSVDTVVMSGGVMQNQLLLCLLHERFQKTKLTIWINHKVPANDGGISLGQAAMACFAD